MVLSSMLPLALATSASAATSRTWTTPGAYEFTVPSGVTKMTVSVTAGGGGGAGSHVGRDFRDESKELPGGGGGGGATVTCSGAVIPGETIYIAVGAGARGGDVGRAGDLGGTSLAQPKAGTINASAYGGSGGGSSRESDEDPTLELTEGGHGGSFFSTKGCSSQREGQAGGSVNPNAKKPASGAGGRAATPGKSCPTGTGDGGKGGDLGAGGSGGRHGCVVITY
ncbi:hypothetical protein [Streptomyces sp. NPDC058401]|uniref:glycine-rich domain-containing protein n=1 Tax=Streptomyces sp. NPDC058401 TaxID=3346480 RepID=UPI00364AB9FD